MIDQYHPQAVEAAWQDWWEAKGFYGADAAKGEAAGEEGRFVMMIPPPNVTGSLHLGHALTTAIEDALTRWHRMCGKEVLWLPGTDHAGIATQVVVEKQLMKESGTSRHDLGREAFVDKVWEWKESKGNRITTQLRHLGASVDWTREAFTMDDQLSRGVGEAFVRLYDEGLIYRDTRLVNWCCTLKTAISDIEVDYIDIEKKTFMSVPGHTGTYEFGTLTSFAYKVDGSATGEEIVVATTRIETMLGDTAVAVHPDDPRYTHLHGKFVVHPFDGRKIPIICDDELVDMSFGTGAVKITPAHDPNDFKCGRKHGLPEITIFTDVGTVNDNGGRYAGMMRFDCRTQIKKDLDEMGLLRGTEHNKMRLGLCSRSGDVVEPLLKPQWWVDCKEMAKAATDAVREGRLKLIPEFHNDTWFRWLDNIRDWCISRQLWWGHRVPAYYFYNRSAPDASSRDDKAFWVAARNADEARAKAAAKLGCAEADVVIEQDEDVLDTWFSSGLFPFSTLGWPEETPDFKGFYPGSLLETGHDILFFWVARMVMLGLKLCGDLPFREVYLHAMVRDKYGRKMSKSLGNVVDPMEVIYGCELSVLHKKLEEGNLPAKEIEKAKKGQTLDFPEGIPECGADALRFGLLAYTIQGRDVNLDINRVVGYRRFCNKLWNATKFALSHFDPAKYTHDKGVTDILGYLAANKAALPGRDRYIMSRLARAAAETTRGMKEYIFGESCEAIYNFWLKELCGEYLEMIKPVVHGSDAAAAQNARYVLYVCLDHGLRLLHPMMPFVTEELWQRLPGRGMEWTAGVPDPESIMLTAWPTPEGLEAWRDEPLEGQMSKVAEVVATVNSMRTSANMAHKTRADITLRCADADELKDLASLADDIATLGGAEKVTCVDTGAADPTGCMVQTVSASVTAFVDVAGKIDVGAQLKKLTKDMRKIQNFIDRLQAKMATAEYAVRVPEEVRTEDAAKLAEKQEEFRIIEDAIEMFKKLA